MKTCIRLISTMLLAFLGVGSLLVAPTGCSADRALTKFGGPDHFVQWAQNVDPRTPKPTGQTSTKKKALDPRSPWPPHWPTHG